MNPKSDCMYTEWKILLYVLRGVLYTAYLKIGFRAVQYVGWMCEFEYRGEIEST